MSSKIPKKDRFSIYLKIENICIEIIDLTITAALEQKFEKIKTLKSLRIKIEKLKRFIRIIYEIDVIFNKTYLELESDLQEISRMTNGWIKYLN